MGHGGYVKYNLAHISAHNWAKNIRTERIFPSSEIVRFPYSLIFSRTGVRRRWSRRRPAPSACNRSGLPCLATALVTRRNVTASETAVCRDGFRNHRQHHRGRDDRNRKRNSRARTFATKLRKRPVEEDEGIRLRNGRTRLAELHWYEAHGICKRDIKRKRYLDESK